MNIEFTREELEAYVKWAEEADRDGWAADKLDTDEQLAFQEFDRKIERTLKS